VLHKTGKKVRVKCTLVEALRLYIRCTAHRGCRSIALLSLDHDTRRGLLFTPWKDPVPIVQDVGWAPGPVWTGAENLTPTRTRSPNGLACSQSLYRLRYPAHTQNWSQPKTNIKALQRQHIYCSSWCHSELKLMFNIYKIHSICIIP